MQAALELAQFLVGRLRVGWNESGLWSPQAAAGTDAAEVEAMEDELYFRLRGVQRAVHAACRRTAGRGGRRAEALCDSLPMGRVG